MFMVQASEDMEHWAHLRDHLAMVIGQAVQDRPVQMPIYVVIL